MGIEMWQVSLMIRFCPNKANCDGVGQSGLVEAGKVRSESTRFGRRGD